MEREAQDAAFQEVMKHWMKSPEGWITARNTGSSFAPIQFLSNFESSRWKAFVPMI